MQLTSPFRFSCPHCHAEVQGFSILRSLEKTTRTSCSICGVALESSFGGLKYVLFLFYTQIVAAPVGIFLIAGALTGRWLWVGGGVACQHPVGVGSPNVSALTKRGRENGCGETPTIRAQTTTGTVRKKPLSPFCAQSY